MRPLAAVVVAVLGGTACGDGGGSGTPDGGGPIDAAPPRPDAYVCVPGADAAPTGTELGDVNGTWAVIELSYAVVGGPLTSTQISRNLYTLDITQTGSDLAIVETSCDIQVDATDESQTTRFLPSLWTNLPSVNKAGKLEPDGAGGFSFSTDTAWRQRGMALDDIENDALPTAATDPSVRDHDADDKPGISLLLDGILRGRAYVVQRESNRYTGKQIGPDLVTGLNAWQSDQVYLGSDPAFIADENVQASPDPDASKHTFQLVRVPAGSDCAYVVANQCTLFAGQ